MHTNSNATTAKSRSSIGRTRQQLTTPMFWGQRMSSDIEKHKRWLRDVGGRTNMEALDAIEALEGEVAQLKRELDVEELACEKAIITATKAEYRAAEAEARAERLEGEVAKWKALGEGAALECQDQKSRAVAADARAERLRVALQAIAEKAGTFDGQGSYTAYVILSIEIEAMADAAIRAAAGGGDFPTQTEDPTFECRWTHGEVDAQGMARVVSACQGFESIRRDLVRRTPQCSFCPHCRKPIKLKPAPICTAAGNSK